MICLRGVPSTPSMADTAESFGKTVLLLPHWHTEWQPQGSRSCAFPEALGTVRSYRCGRLLLGDGC